MDPVARTLQTIAAIQGETCERHVDAASTYSTEPVHSQSLSASSLSIGRDRQTAPFSKSEASALPEPVRALVDPQGRGRQHIAARLVQLTGTPAGGFVLTR
jgi:hypothetical protein